jgi:hypothetical protein
MVVVVTYYLTITCTLYNYLLSNPSKRPALSILFQSVSEESLLISKHLLNIQLKVSEPSGTAGGGNDFQVLHRV